MIILNFVQDLFHDNTIKYRVSKPDADNILKSSNTDTWEGMVIMKSLHTGQYRQFEYLFKCPCTYSDNQTRYIYYSKALDKFLHIDVVP